MRILVLRYGPITITREIEAGLPVKDWYWIGARNWRVVEIR